MTIGEFITKIGFKVDKEPLDNMEHSLESIKHVLLAITGFEIAKGLVEFTEKFTEFAESLHIAAEGAGITVEEFQKLAFAAQQSAVSQDQLSFAMAKLARNLYDARKGGVEANKAFAEAGFTPEQIASFRNTDEVLSALADRFAGTQDVFKKQAIAQELLGRGGRNFVEFLSKGSGSINRLKGEAGALGAVLSGPAVDSLIKAQHSLEKFWAVIKVIAGTIAANLAPTIVYVTGLWLKLWEANKKVFEANIQKWFYQITYALGFIYGVVEGLTKKVIQFAEAHPLLTKRVLEVIAALIVLAGIMKGIYTIMSLLQGVIGFVSFALTPLTKGWDLLVLSLEFVKGALVGVVEWMAYAFDSSLALEAAIAIAEAPLLLVAAAIGAIVVALHDLYTLIFGSGKLDDTWVGKFLNWATPSGFNPVNPTAGKKRNIDWSNPETYSAGPNFPTGPASYPGGSGGGGNNLNAPITQNFYGVDSPEEAGKRASQGVENHFDRILREYDRDANHPVGQ